MTESEQTRAFCHQLRQAGCIVINYVGNVRQGSGWPDRWIGSPKWAGWIEFKAEKGKLSVLQFIAIKMINTVRPGEACVLRFIGTGKNKQYRLETYDGTEIQTVSTPVDILDALANWREKQLRQA